MLGIITLLQQTMNTELEINRSALVDRDRDFDNESPPDLPAFPLLDVANMEMRG